MLERGKGKALERRYTTRRYMAEKNFQGWAVWVPCLTGWRLFADPYAMLPTSTKEATT
jgi:hypothetical protein